MSIERVSTIYKLGIVSPKWTPQLMTRAMRDILTVNKMARAENVVLQVAVDPTFTQALQLVTGVSRVDDMSGCKLYRIYVDRSLALDADVDMDHTGMIPEEGEHDHEVIEINRPGNIRPLIVEKDPYAGVKFFKNWYHIPPTIDLNKPAPKFPKGDEPMYSPYL